MIYYKTVKKEAEAEQVIEKSRFIAKVKPVTTREDADAFITSIKATYPDASHHVPALTLGDKFQTRWASDDGEPRGTAGAPILQMLVKEGITNTVIVVTRYFGGIKLGTGGLIRAYTSSARLAVQAAEICEVKEKAVLIFQIPYPYLSKIQVLAGEGHFQIKDIRYEDKITIEIQTALEEEEKAIALFADLTSGTAICLSRQRELAFC